MSNHVTINVQPETKQVLSELKNQGEEALTWDEFMRRFAEGELQVSWDEVEVEVTEERVERTRATVVAILDAVEEYDLTEDILDILKTLSQQDMLATNQRIVDYLLRKAENGTPLNEVDHLLADVVMETEQEREMEQSPAAEIAQGLVSETDRITAERKTSKQHSTSKGASVLAGGLDSDGDDESEENGLDEPRFSIIESDEEL